MEKHQYCEERKELQLLPTEHTAIKIQETAAAGSLSYSPSTPPHLYTNLVIATGIHLCAACVAGSVIHDIIFPAYRIIIGSAVAINITSTGYVGLPDIQPLCP